MAKKKGGKLEFPKRGKILMWVVGVVLAMSVIYSKLGPTANLGKILRIGNPFDRSVKEITLQSCGSKLPNYKYSIQFPANWTLVRRSYDEASTYFDAKFDDVTFTISCTNQGVGGGCEPQYRTKFKVADKEYNACFGVFNGSLFLNNFNLDTDKNTNATISFWADGLDRPTIQEILNSYKLIENQ